MVNITINGKAIQVPPGTTVLRAAEQAGITIPTLCDHPDLHPFGGCRLCVVEVQGARLQSRQEPLVDEAPPGRHHSGHRAINARSQDPTLPDPTLIDRGRTQRHRDYVPSCAWLPAPCPI